MAALCAGLLSCGDTDAVLEAGDVVGLADTESALRQNTVHDARFQSAGREFGVPPALLKALAYSQTRFEMVLPNEEFEEGPRLAGLMGLSRAQVEAAAALLGVSENAVSFDAETNVRAAAALLASKWPAGSAGRSLREWTPALEAYSGLESADMRRHFVEEEVLRAVRSGLGTLTGELTAEQTQGLELGVTRQALGGAPDYPPATWRASNGFGSRGGRKAQLVIIHTCEGAYSGCVSYLTSSGLASHYVVGAGVR